MGLFLVKRLITLVATLVGASIVVFAVLEVLPGNAAQILMVDRGFWGFFRSQDP